MKKKGTENDWDKLREGEGETSKGQCSRMKDTGGAVVWGQIDRGQLMVGEGVQNSNHHFTQSYRKYYNPIKCISITN